MLAGPSELLVLADDSAVPATVAADLLAQVCSLYFTRILFLHICASESVCNRVSSTPAVVLLQWKRGGEGGGFVPHAVEYKGKEYHGQSYVLSLTQPAHTHSQAEHDTLALPVLVTTSEKLVPLVEDELKKQLAVLPTAPTASVSVGRGFAVVCPSMEVAIDITNRVAPEHLELLVENADEVFYFFS